MEWVSLTLISPCRSVVSSPDFGTILVERAKYPELNAAASAVRKVKEGRTTNDLFAFLTTELNAIIALIHAKAMPVILTVQEEVDAWMTAPAN